MYAVVNKDSKPEYSEVKKVRQIVYTIAMHVAVMGWLLTVQIVCLGLFSWCASLANVLIVSRPRRGVRGSCQPPYHFLVQ